MRSVVAEKPLIREGCGSKPTCRTLGERCREASWSCPDHYEFPITPPNASKCPTLRWAAAERPAGPAPITMTFPTGWLVSLCPASHSAKGSLPALVSARYRSTCTHGRAPLGSCLGGSFNYCLLKQFCLIRLCSRTAHVSCSGKVHSKEHQQPKNTSTTTSTTQHLSLYQQRLTCTTVTINTALVWHPLLLTCWAMNSLCWFSSVPKCEASCLRILFTVVTCR